MIVEPLDQFASLAKAKSPLSSIRLERYQPSTSCLGGSEIDVAAEKRVLWKIDPRFMCSLCMCSLWALYLLSYMVAHSSWSTQNGHILTSGRYA